MVCGQKRGHRVVTAMTLHLCSSVEMLTMLKREGKALYSRREDGVRQRQSLQVGHQAVGQETVDGGDLRGGRWFNCEKEKV